MRKNQGNQRWVDVQSGKKGDYGVVKTTGMCIRLNVMAGKRRLRPAFGHGTEAAEQQNNKGNASAPYLKVLKTGEGGFYRLDHFHGIGDADGVVDEDGIGDDVVFVHVPVALEKDGIGFLTNENGIVTVNGIADKMVVVVDFYGFCRNMAYRFTGGEKKGQPQEDCHNAFIFHFFVVCKVAFRVVFGRRCGNSQLAPFRKVD